jgi:hypothetical protein
MIFLEDSITPDHVDFGFDFIDFLMLGGISCGISGDYIFIGEFSG